MSNVTVTDLKELILEDPFSETTRKIKRNLLFFSFISIVLSIYPEIFKPSIILPFDFKEAKDAPFLMFTLMLIIQVYLTVTWMIYSFQEHSAWKLKTNVTFAGNIWNTFHQFAGTVTAIQQFIEKNKENNYEGFPIGNMDAFEKKLDDLRKNEMSEFQILLDKQATKEWLTRKSQEFKVNVIDLSLPFLITLIALSFLIWNFCSKGN